MSRHETATSQSAVFRPLQRAQREGDPAGIVVNLHQFTAGVNSMIATMPRFIPALQRPADIEGVLIHGAQGVRSLSVLPITRSDS